MTDDEIIAMWQRQDARCGFNLIAFARAVEGVVQYEMLVQQEQVYQPVEHLSSTLLESNDHEESKEGRTASSPSPTRPGSVRTEPVEAQS
jgi:hypothetical protein